MFEQCFDTLLVIRLGLFESAYTIVYISNNGKPQTLAPNEIRLFYIEKRIPLFISCASFNQTFEIYEIRISRRHVSCVTQPIRKHTPNTSSFARI